MLPRWMRRAAASRRGLYSKREPPSLCSVRLAAVATASAATSCTHAARASTAPPANASTAQTTRTAACSWTRTGPCRRAIASAMPSASSAVYSPGARTAARMQRQHRRAYSPTSTATPTNPSSSPAIVMMKSVSPAGTTAPLPRPRPLPQAEPVASAHRPWAIWSPPGTPLLQRLLAQELAAPREMRGEREHDEQPDEVRGLEPEQPQPRATRSRPGAKQQQQRGERDSKGEWPEHRTPQRRRLQIHLGRQDQQSQSGNDAAHGGEEGHRVAQRIAERHQAHEADAAEQQDDRQRHGIADRAAPPSPRVRNPERCDQAEYRRHQPPAIGFRGAHDRVRLEIRKVARREDGNPVEPWPPLQPRPELYVPPI